jgi:EAL domain-containing protein (putative c-di-GMP-specific phosphodiesterase class I)
VTMEADVTLASVLSDGLYCVFQPVVDLDSDAVAGYEALMRGPAGSALERPDQLLEDARRLGQLHVLDWAAREKAVSAARGAGLRLPLSLFVNAEPEALGEPGEDQHWRSFGDLRCYTEITERALMHRPAELLRSIDRIREQDWGIALDDIGAAPESLGLMPLLRPDVLKLDMRLLARRPDWVTSNIVHAVMAQAAETGAAVVAEGIEDARQLDLARGYGAHFGQGYLLGRPAPLPEHIVTARRAVPMLARINDKALPPTPFAAIVDAASTRQLGRATMVELVRQLLTQALRLHPAPVVLMQLAEEENLTPELVGLLGAVAQRSPMATVLGGGPAIAGVPGLRVARLDRTGPDPVANFPLDLTVAVLSPYYTGALAGRPQPDTAGTDSTTVYDAALVFDRSACVRVSTLLFTRLPVAADRPPGTPDS